jgi:Flp pilus assembly protein TadG
MRRFHPDRGGRTDRGSVLMLVPAGVLVVLVLASIAVDMTLVHLRQRQAVDLAAAAANDAATAAADQGRARAGDFRVDLATAERVAARVVGASGLADDLVGSPVVRPTGDGGVEVEVALYADYIFAGVVPGSPDGTTVTGSASAAALEP